LENSGLVIWEFRGLGILNLEFQSLKWRKPVSGIVLAAVNKAIDLAEKNYQVVIGNQAANFSELQVSV
jgi:3-hydroxyacyl-CoA dehydrogenase